MDQPPEDASAGDWDSLQQLAIALAVEETCGRRPVGDDIFELRSLADVACALRDAAASGSAALADSTGGRPTDPEWLPLLPFSAAAPLQNGRSAPVLVGDPVSVVVAASFTAEPIAASLRQWSARRLAST